MAGGPRRRRDLIFRRSDVFRIPTRRNWAHARVSAHQSFSEVLVYKQIACGYVTNHLGWPVAHGNPGT